MTANQIAYMQAQETARANRAKEAETFRSNVAQEGLKFEQQKWDRYYKPLEIASKGKTPFVRGSAISQFYSRQIGDIANENKSGKYDPYSPRGTGKDYTVPTQYQLYN